MPLITCPCCHRTAEQPTEFLFDWETRRVATRHGVAELTWRQADILWLILSSPGRVCRREKIYAGLEGASSETVSRKLLDVHMTNLRAKLDPIGMKIRTIERYGYRYDGVFPPPRERRQNKRTLELVKFG